MMRIRMLTLAALLLLSIGGCGNPDGPVTATLRWDQPVDLDLEIWDAAGNSVLTRGYDFCGEDITDGARGEETFVFQSYDAANDFSTGTYRVGTFIPLLDPTAPPLTATLEVAGAAGTTTSSFRVEPGAGGSQWFAFQVDAATRQVQALTSDTAPAVPPAP